MEENQNENANAQNEEHQENAPAEQHVDNSASVNIANLRAAKEKAEKERAEMVSQIEEMKKLQQQQEEPPEEPDYSDGDFVEGKHLKKEIEAINKQLAAYKHQQTEATDETRLKQVYSDFDKVVNQENLDKLKELDPDTAETIAMSQASLYTRGSAAYKRIKELNLIVEDNHAQDREKAHANVAKPRPMNSVSPQQGESPLSMANAFSNGLTDELKKQLWKEMQDSAKRH